jgi:hypothetical protein
MRKEWALMHPQRTLFVLLSFGTAAAALTEYAAHAHRYRYFSDGKQGRFSGEASSLPSVRVAMAFPPTTPAVTNG